ncbi:MAG: cadmium-translocating P-type ATPase [Bacteroidaceae bacterium]|nr:cadmium-translocating P-type ATPase [Bacteroidaceae bacterium]
MKKKIVRIIAAAVLLAAAMVVEHTCGLPAWAVLGVYLIPYIIIGYDVLGEAVEGIVEGKPTNENLLMAIATLGALAVGFLPGGEPQAAEAVAVMLFFQIGEAFEHLAEHRSRRAISHLLAIRPDTATLVTPGGEREVDAAQVRTDDVLLVRPGDRVPTDGVVLEGTSALDTSALTGESLPRRVAAGDEVLSGCINQSGVLRLRATRPASESTVSRIIELVERAAEKKSRSETFIRRFARVYTPLVVAAALVVAFVPPLWAAGGYMAALPTWLLRALTFLVVSCPCALVISVPLTFFGGIGAASRQGILVKGAAYIDLLAKARTVVFDKTGTLTSGAFKVQSVAATSGDKDSLLRLAAQAERHSTHPVATAIREACPDAEGAEEADEIQEIAGQGVRAIVGGRTVCVGNRRLMEVAGAVAGKDAPGGTTVHVSVDGEYAGCIVIADSVKPEARKAVLDLLDLGVERTAMLSGDTATTCAEVAADLGVGTYHAGLLPADKVARLAEIKNSTPDGGCLVFVGDGINDAPVLAGADVGVAMGALGSDAAIEAADVVLMNDSLEGVPRAIRTSRRTVAIARQNLVFAIGVKVAVLLLATVGLASMWLAVFADVGVMVLCVLNAMRTLLIGRRYK